MFSCQGKKLWSVTLPHSVICIEKMDIPSRGMFLVAVALSSNHVLVYNDKNVVDCFKTDDAVSAMKFGRFGREENTLVIGMFVHLFGDHFHFLHSNLNFSNYWWNTKYENTEEDRPL